MKKIRLEMDALRVESFDTGAGRSARGTVHARQTRDAYCPELPPPDDSINVCPPPTGAPSCAGTCGSTCGSTCGCAQTFGAWTCVGSTCPDPATADIELC